MAEERQRKSGGGGIGEGIRTGIGILNAFKEAVEETLQEAVDRGDLSPDRAKRAMRDAAQRVQETLEQTRERMEFVTQRELQDLRDEVDRLRRRVAELESSPRAAERGGAGPDETETPGGIIITE